MTDKADLIPTENGFGWTSTIPNPITCRFLSDIERQFRPRVIDIGAGFGVATLPALAAGAYVIANDISSAHLEAIEIQARSTDARDRLTTLKAALPHLPYLEGLDAVHASNVLHFLTGAEMIEAARWMWRSLKPNGRAYVQVQSPWIGHYQAFLPEYHRRKALHLRWPGEMHDARRFAAPEIRDITPEFGHVVEAEVARQLFEQAGFDVEYCEYYRRPGLPKVCWLDGRENLGMIAAKKVCA
jgi:SAM-dependent methyltransferase